LQRDEGRRLFGLDPIGYRNGRPDYPEAVYEILVQRCGLGPATQALEIGPCGDYFQTVESTPQGTFGVVVTVHRTYTVEQGNAGGGESPAQIDCSQPLRCFLVAEESSPPYSSASSMPLTFAAPASGTG